MSQEPKVIDRRRNKEHHGRVPPESQRRERGGSSKQGETFTQFFAPERAGWMVTRAELLSIIGVYHAQEQANTYGARLRRFLRGRGFHRIPTMGDIGAGLNDATRAAVLKQVLREQQGAPAAAAVEAEAPPAPPAAEPPPSLITPA